MIQLNYMFSFLSKEKKSPHNKANKEGNGLPEFFTVMENFTLEDHGPIEKIIMGPTGIWAINSIDEKGEITFVENMILINKKALDVNPIEKLRDAAGSVSDSLRIRVSRDCFVKPVLVFNNPEAQLPKEETVVNGVYAILSGQLNNLITKQTEGFTFNEDLISKIKTALNALNKT